MILFILDFITLLNFNGENKMKKILIIMSILLSAIMLIAAISGCGMTVAPVSLNPTLPENWPSVVPINNDITITNSATNPEKLRYVVQGDFNIPIEEMYNYYKDQFSGWTLSYDDTSENKGLVSYAIGFNNEQYDIMIEIIQEKNDKDQISITVHDKSQP
jgi:hypothetical protein